MKKETLILILRWIAVLPAAIAAGMGVTLLGYLFSDVDPSYNPLIGLFSSAAAVAAGSYTAPSGIVVMSIEEAEDYGLTPCGYCY